VDSYPSYAVLHRNKEAIWTAVPAATVWTPPQRSRPKEDWKQCGRRSCSSSYMRIVWICLIPG